MAWPHLDDTLALQAAAHSILVSTLKGRSVIVGMAQIGQAAKVALVMAALTAVA